MMPRSTKPLALVLALLLIAILGELLFLYFHQTAVSPPITGLKNQPSSRPSLPLPTINNPDGNFTHAFQTVPEGFSAISGNPAIFSFVSTIQQVSTDSSGVYLTASLGNFGEQKFILSDGKSIAVILVRQNTYDLNPLSSQSKVVNLAPNVIAQELRPFIHHHAIFTLSLLPPPFSSDMLKIPSVSKQMDFIKKYLSCNQNFAVQMKNQAAQNTACTPEVAQINVYVPTL